MSAALIPAISAQKSSPQMRALVPPQQKDRVDRIAAAVRWFREEESKKEWVGRRWQLLSEIGAQMEPPLSAKQLHRYINRFERALKARQNPEVALCKVSRKGQGQFFNRHHEAAEFVAYKYYRERVGSYTLTHEALLREFDRFRCKEGHRLTDGRIATCTPPDKDTVRRFLRSAPRPFRTLALQGPRAWRSECAPHLLRELPPPGEWFVMDGRRLDIQCVNTLFPELRPGAMYRPEITLAFDWGSGLHLGYTLAPHSSSRTIMHAARMAISDWGLPANFLWDNGEDYKKVQRILEGKDLGGEFESALSNVLGDHGVNVTRALPYRPASKPIEPACFSVMSRRFDCIFGDAYQGNSPVKRTEYNDAAQKRHAKWQTGKAPDSPLPADVEVFAALIAWMNRENNRPRKKLGGLTPLQALEKHLPPQKRRLPGPGVLNLLFAERDKRTVQRGGIIRLDNRAYEPTDASLVALSDLKGSEVIVLRDSYSLENAVALDPKDLFIIGELQLQEFFAQCPNGHVTRDAIKANERRVALLRKRFTESLAWLAVMAERQNWKSEREVLLEEAGFATGTDGRALPLAAVPGARAARQLPAAPAPALAPAFVSDGVRNGPDFANLELED